MKFIYIITAQLLFALGTSHSKAQTISFPDKNFKEALLAVGVDTNNDGNIQKSEAAKVKKLYVNNAGITSLVGIKNFTSLEDFGFFENKVKSLDLEGMKSLKFIYGFRNEITQVKLKGCANLVEVALDNNLLSTFDLTGFNELVEIDINWNQLQSVNVSNNPKLQKVWMFDNEITEFKADGSLELKDLDLSGNNLSEMDLRQFTNLRSVKLVDNLLRKINVTGLSALETLNCEAIKKPGLLTQINTSGLMNLKEFKW